MRPINLIPKDLRRGDAAPSRTGATGWVIVGALALAVVAAVLLVTTSNTLSDRENEVAALQHAEQVAQRQAAEVAPYTAFQQTVAARRQTVAGLAASRFDWERVMRELALIIPEDIVVRTLTATVSPEVSVAGATSVDLRGSVPGPALELTGCGIGRADRSQETIAGFISALYDIDGVTRVGMKDAIVTAEAGAADGDGAGRAGACAAAGQQSSFQIVAAFDAAPTVPLDGSIPDPPAPEPAQETASEGEATPASDTTAEASDATAGASDTTAEAAGGNQATKVKRARNKADKATDTFLPGNGR